MDTYEGKAPPHDQRKIIAGVCLRAAGALGLDPSLVRIVTGALFLLDPSFILIYLLAGLLLSSDAEKSAPGRPGSGLVAFVAIGVSIALVSCLVRLFFPVSLGFYDYLSLAVFISGVYVFVDAASSARGEQEGAGQQQMLIGLVVCVTGAVMVLGTFDIATVETESILGVLSAEWPLLAAAAVVNVLFLGKRSAVMMWTGIFAFTMLAALFIS